MPSLALTSYVLMAASRDRILLAMLLALALVCCFALFFGAIAVVEKNAFSLVFTASGLRHAGVLALILFVSFFVRRSFDAKEVEFFLTRPISRTSFVSSYFVAFAAVAAFVTLLQTLCLMLFSYGGFGAGHMWWCATLLLENMLMVFAACFFAMQISSASASALAGFGFYALSRMIGSVLGTLDAGVTGGVFKWLATLMDGVSYVIPRLDLFAQSSWLLYADMKAGILLLIGLQAVVFSAIFFVMTAIDLTRKQF